MVKKLKYESQVSETREPKRRTQSSSCSRQRYKQQVLAHTLSARGRVTNDENKSNAVTTTTEEGSEFQYISTILLTRTTTVPHKPFNFQWFSRSHPLDPSIFHQLELYPSYNSIASYPGNYKDSIFTQNNKLGPRCNRRLLFDLVDEVLSEILVKPKCYCNYDDGMLLLERVWKKVRSFPRAKCEVLEDIDRLIDMNEEEGEGGGLVAEIEGNIFETLVHETVTVMVRCCGSVREIQRRLDHVLNGGDMKQRVSRGDGGSRDEIDTHMAMDPSFMEVVNCDGGSKHVRDFLKQDFVEESMPRF